MRPPIVVVSFHRVRSTAGSSSAPARNVSRIAPVLARNFIHDWSAPSAAAPTSAPIASWATMPTTISDMAVAMRSQIDSRVAASASPSHSAASA